MKKINIFCMVLVGFLFSFSTFVFPQQTPQIIVYGNIPNSSDENLYRIQVGAFIFQEYAENAFNILMNAELTPLYEEFNEFTRVLIRGINAAQVPQYIERLRVIGFSEVFIRVDSSTLTTTEPVIDALPIRAAALPQTHFTEIAHHTIRIGETSNLSELAGNRNIMTWTSSTPQAVSVDQMGSINGLMLGNALIMINQTEYISVAVVPAEDFFVVPESMVDLLPAESKASSSTRSLTEYRTEPTFRLAYRWNNRGESRGASGSNGGIDILGRGENYEWLWTTYFQGGWFYSLNGVERIMIDGFQRSDNGVELQIFPEFIYEDGVPYLQLRHTLTNTSNNSVTGQRFGASADVMIHNNDFAPLILTHYGAYMADSMTDPSLELILICLEGEGITPVDTLWLGTYMWGDHINNIYVDRRINVQGQDSAIAFSWQNIDLLPGETKDFIVRFTLARSSD